MKVRLAKLTDIPAIIKVRERSIKNHCSKQYSKEAIKAWSKAGPTEAALERDIEKKLVFVVDNEGTLEGYAHLRAAQRSFGNWISNLEGIFVTNKASGQGYGKKLMDRVNRVAKEKQYDRIKLCSTMNAVDFFKSYGYEFMAPSLKLGFGGEMLDFVPMFVDIIKEPISTNKSA